MCHVSHAVFQLYILETEIFSPPTKYTAGFSGKRASMVLISANQTLLPIETLNDDNSAVD